jgi:large subunit ribosomal protein L34
MSKKTYQPNKKRALKKHGFLKRMETKSGRNVLKARRQKGRQVIAKQAK